MLKIFRIALMLVASVAIFSSCEKETSVENGVPGGIPGGGGGGTGSFRAKIDGVQWIANSSRSATIMDDIIAIQGTSSDGKTMLLRVADSGVHNYSFANYSSTNVGAFTDSSIVPIAALTTNQWPQDSIYGTMNVTSINTTQKTISGTFKMYVIRALDGVKRNITEGVFSDITYATTLPPPASTDSFTVKINGTEFMETFLLGIKGMGNINISATNAEGASVSIVVPDNITPGTYTFGTIVSPYYGQYNVNSSTFTMSNSGTLTILEHNTTTKRIRANFNYSSTEFGTTTPVYNLTEGYVSLTYQ